MILLVDHHSGTPIYRQIMDQVKLLISTGHMKSGEQIKSVKDLSLELGVNPMTVSKAYQLLETESWLERRRGVGLFVRPKVETASSPDEVASFIKQAAALADCARKHGISRELATQICIKEIAQVFEAEGSLAKGKEVK